jgi:lipid A disaccharide synthetase
VILALTANGPGEFAGWVRPLLAALYARAPELDVRVFCVPDDYATGYEPAYLKRLFPAVTVYPTATYLRLALGRPVEGLPARVDRVQYLGGDLMHAARLHDRLGGIATAYKFSRKRYAGRYARVFALDAANRQQLLDWGTPADRIAIVGNLAIDGALGEAAGRFGTAGSEAAPGGVLLFPGSRKHEVANVLPMFVRAAVQLQRRLPGVPIAFARAPFADDRAVEAALAGGGVRTAYGLRATLERDAAGVATAIRAEGERFALVEAGMRAATRARLAVAIPGTKLVELAALGVPTISVAPFNAPELAVINGPLQYAGRLPLIGTPLKRTAAVAVAKRFRWFAQPNIDAGRELIPELRGTIVPALLASAVVERFHDDAWRTAVAPELRALYAGHAGAAERMAAALLEEDPQQ